MYSVFCKKTILKHIKCCFTIDYRIKSIPSAIQKYERYYPDHQAAKVFNDLLGFRTFCDNYENVLQLDE